jgi:hypothetical protein
MRILFCILSVVAWVHLMHRLDVLRDSEYTNMSYLMDLQRLAHNAEIQASMSDFNEKKIEGLLNARLAWDRNAKESELNLKLDKITGLLGGDPGVSMFQAVFLPACILGRVRHSCLRAARPRLQEDSHCLRPKRLSSTVN